MEYFLDQDKGRSLAGRALSELTHGFWPECAESRTSLKKKWAGLTAIALPETLFGVEDSYRLDGVALLFLTLPIDPGFKLTGCFFFD